MIKAINLKKYWATILLVLLIITEFIFKFYDFELRTRTEISRNFKITLSLIVLGYILLKKTIHIIPLLLLSLIFFIGQFNIIENFNKEVVIIFSKCIYFLIFVYVFNNLKLNKTQLDYLFKGFELLLIFNFFLIIIGYIFKVKFFETYFFSRFGYNGVFINSATSSYVYILALIYIKNKFDNIFRHPIFYITILSTLFVGTKVLYGFIFVFIFFEVLNNFKKYRSLIISGFLLLLILGNYIIFYEIEVLSRVRVNEGILSALMSRRNTLFMQKTLPYIKENWTTINFMFGGLSNLNVKTQNTIVDMLLLFGFLGTFLYFSIMFKILKDLILKNKLYITILFLFIIFAGNFYEYSSITIYVVILNEKVKIQNN